MCEKEWSENTESVHGLERKKGVSEAHGLHSKLRLRLNVGSKELQAASLVEGRRAGNESLHSESIAQLIAPPPAGH